MPDPQKEQSGDPRGRIQQVQPGATSPSREGYDNPIVTALGDFYERMDGTRPSRSLLEDHARKWAGQETEMWRSITQEYGLEVPDEALANTVNKYPNSYNLKKKPGPGDGGSSGDVTAAVKIYSGTEGTPTPLVKPADNLTEAQRFAQRVVYGTTEGDYNRLYANLDQTYAAQLRAVDRRVQRGDLTEEDAAARREAALAKKASEVAYLDKMRKAGAPAAVAGEDDTPPAAFDQSTFLDVADKYGTLPFQEAFDMLNAQLPEMLGVDRDEAFATYNKLVDWSEGENLAWNDQHPLAGKRIDGERYLIMSPKRLNRLILDRGQAAVKAKYPNLPDAFFEAYEQSTVGRDYAGVSDLARSDNPFGRMADNLATQYVDENLPELEGGQRQRARREITQLIRTAHRYREARNEASAALTGSPAASAQAFAQKLESLDNALAAQHVEIEQRAASELAAANAAAKERILAFDESLAEQGQAYQARLQAQLQAGQLTEAEATEQLQAYRDELRSQRRDMYNSETRSLMQQAAAYRRQWEQAQQENRAEVARIASDLGIEQDEQTGSYRLSNEYLADYQALTESYLADAAADEYRRGQEEFAGLSFMDKLDRGFEKGVMDLMDAAGMTIGWLGADDIGQDLSFAAQQRAAELPLRDFGSFEWADMADADWWASKAVPTMPLAASMMVGGGLAGAAGRGVATALGGGALAGTVSAITSGAVGMRLLESSMEAAGRYQQSIDMGKGEEVAAADARYVFGKTAMLVGLDAIQYALAFAPPVFRVGQKAGKAAQIAQRGMSSLAAGGVAIATEGLEEAWVGYASHQVDNPSANFIDYLQSPEGTEQAVLGGLMGIGFHIGGSLTPRGYDAATNRSLYEMATRTDVASQNEALDKRAAQMNQGLSLLEERGVITSEKAAAARADLNAQTEDYKKLIAGELPVTVADGARAQEYVLLMSQSRHLEAQEQAATDDSTRDNIARERRKVRDRMQELADNAAAPTYRLDGVPMSAENLESIVTDPEVARAIALDTVEVNNDPLTEIRIFSKLANNQRLAPEQTQQAVQRVEAAMQLLTEASDQPGNLHALAERAQARDDIADSGMKDTWQLVREVLEEVAAPGDTQYQGLRDIWQAEEAAVEDVDNAPLDTEAAPDVADTVDTSGVERAAVREEADEAEAMGEAFEQERTKGMESDLNAEYYRITAMPEGMRAIREADPDLADKIDDAEPLTLEEKAKAVKYGQEATPEATRTTSDTQADPEAQAEEAVVGFDAGPLPDSTLEMIDLEFANRAPLRDELVRQSPELAKAYEDNAAAALTPQQQQELLAFVNKTKNRALSDPDLYVQQYDEGANNFIAATAKKIVDMLGGSNPVNLNAVPAFMRPGRRRRVLQAGEDTKAEQARQADAMELLTAMAEAVLASGGKTFREFQSRLANYPGLNRIGESVLRASWDQALTQTELRAENPVQFYSELGFWDSLRRVFQDTRRALKVLVDKVDKSDKLNFITDENGRAINPYEAFELLVSRAANRIDEMQRKIIGVRPSENNSKAINDRSFVGRWEEATGFSVRDFSLLAYARHALDFNPVARQRIQARRDAKLEELNRKLERIDDKMADAAANGATSELRALRTERAAVQADLDRILSGEANEYFVPDDPSGMSDADAQRIIDEARNTTVQAERDVATGQETSRSLYDAYEEFYAEFKTEVIDARIIMMRDEGLITQELAENLLEGKRPVGLVKQADGTMAMQYEEGFSNYVPLKVNPAARVRYEGAIADAETGGDGEAGIQNIFGTYRYGMLERNDPFIQAISQYEATVRQVEKNRAMKQMMELVKSLKDPRFAQVIPAGDTTIIDDSGTFKTQRDTTSSSIKKHAIPVHKNGKLFYVYFRPVRNKKGEERPHPVLQAIEQAGRVGTHTGIEAIDKIIGGFRTYVSWKRNVITAFNPFFAPVNFVRDFSETMLNVASIPRMTDEEMKGLRMQIIKNVPGAARALWHHGFKGIHADQSHSEMANYLREAYEDGVKVSWSQYNDPSEKIEKVNEILARQKRFGFEEGLRKTAASDLKEMGLTAVSWTQTFNDIMENAMRVSTYAALRKKGIDRQSAAAAAKNITLNFEKKGTWGSAINTLFLFANAGIQGTVRGLANVKTPRGRKSLAGLVAAGVMFAAWREFYDHEDELEIKTDSFDRANYLIIPIPGSRTVLKIPKAYGPGRVFFNLGENVYRLLSGKDSLYTFLQANLIENVAPLVDPIGGASANPVSAWSPTVVTPMVEYMTNMNFTGSQWYYASKYADLQERVAYNQPEIIAEMTGWLNDAWGVNVPPVLVWIYYKELTGGIGGEGANLYRLWMEDEQAMKAPLNYVPLARRFALDLDGADYKALSNLDDLLNRGPRTVEKLGGLTDAEIARSKRAWKYLRERRVYSNRKMSQLRNVFRDKYKIDLRR